MENKQTTNEKKSRYKDGWHTIRVYYVLVENGRITRGMKKEPHGISLVPSYPYRKAQGGGYDLCSGISVNTFRRHPDKYFIF